MEEPDLFAVKHLRDLRDIRGMLAVSGDSLDCAMLDRAITELGLAAAFKACLD